MASGDGFWNDSDRSRITNAAWIVPRGSFLIGNADVTCGRSPKGLSGDDRVRGTAVLTELVRRGPGRKGRVVAAGVTNASRRRPQIGVAHRPRTRQIAPSQKKTADSSLVSTHSSLCGSKWVAEPTGLGQGRSGPASCRSGRKCRLRSFSAEMRSGWAVAGLPPQPFHRLTCTSVWTTFFTR